MVLLNVVIPPGMKPGQEIQATSPDGVIVKATIPSGLKPGQTFSVQYTAPAGATAGAASTSTPSGSSCIRLMRMYSGGDLIVLCGLVVIGFSLPMFIKHAGSILNILATYVLPVIVAGLAVAYDWSLKGPTVALKNTLAAAVVAWILVVPLGVVTHSLLNYFTSLIIVAAASLLILSVFLQFGLCGGWLFALLILSVFIVFGGSMVWLISGPLGGAVIFLVAFFCTRVIFGVIFLRDLDPSAWPHVKEVEKNSDEFRSQKEYFMTNCQPWAHKYDFNLSVSKIYRIDKPDPWTASSADSSRALFHGTSWEAAMGIVCDGFRLPSHPGMFGKGIYFADCPLKSWRYCFPSQEMANTLPRITGKGGYILMCWVDLGTTRQEKVAKPDLKGYNRKSWWNWITRQRGAYDSVTGLTEEEGGALRVPEYIVYDPKQVRLAYLFEVFKEARSAASASNNTASNTT